MARRAKNNKGEKKFKPVNLGSSPSLPLPAPGPAPAKDLAMNPASSKQTKQAEAANQVKKAYAHTPGESPFMAARRHWQNLDLQSKSEPDSIPTGEEGAVHTNPDSSPSLPIPAPVKGTVKNAGPSKQAHHAELPRQVKGQFKTARKTRAFKTTRRHWENRFDDEELAEDLKLLNV